MSYGSQAAWDNAGPDDDCCFTPGELERLAQAGLIDEVTQ